METVTIPIQELNVLRETFKMASEILDRYGVTGNVQVPSTSPKETKKQRAEKYAKLIESNSRGKKPDYLKKKHGKN